MAETKSINFDNHKGLIHSNGECIGYLRLQDEWEPITSKFYKLLDAKCPFELQDWDVNIASYTAGDSVSYNNTAYFCLHDNIPSLTPVENNPKLWRNYSNSFPDIKRGDIVGTYREYRNYALNSENLLNGWIYNSALVYADTEKTINGKQAWKLQSDASSSAIEHSIGQELYFTQNSRVCMSAYVQQNVSRTVGLGFKIRNDSRQLTYLARYDIQLGTVVDTKVYDAELNETTDPNLLTSVSARIQIIDAKTYTFRISLFGTTSQESYIDCKLFMIGDAPKYDVKFISSLETGFHILNVNFVQIEKTIGDLPSAYIQTSKRIAKGYQPVKFYQKIGNEFKEYKELTSKFHFSTNLSNIRDMVNGDYAFIANGIYFPDRAYLGELNDYQAEIDTLLYKNLFTDKYTISVNDEHYTLETGFDYKPKLVDALTFNKYGYQRVAGYSKIC